MSRPIVASKAAPRSPGIWVMIREGAVLGATSRTSASRLDWISTTALRRATPRPMEGVAVRAAERVLTQGDASGMFDDQQLGRLGRDVHMAGLQASLTWDEPAQTFSRLRWGLPASSFFN